MIRYVTGDEEPLARIVVEPMSKPNVDTEIKIDQHLVALGVKLSKNDALQRYVRTKADQNDAEDAPLVQGQTPMAGAPATAPQLRGSSATFRGLENKSASSSRPPYLNSGGRATSMKSPQDDILSAFARTSRRIRLPRARIREKH